MTGLATSEFRNFSYEIRKHLEFFSENLEQPRPKILNFEISSPYDQPEARKPCAFSPPPNVTSEPYGFSSCPNGHFTFRGSEANGLSDSGQNRATEPTQHFLLAKDGFVLKDAVPWYAFPNSTHKVIDLILGKSKPKMTDDGTSRLNASQSAVAFQFAQVLEYAATVLAVCRLPKNGAAAKTECNT